MVLIVGGSFLVGVIVGMLALAWIALSTNDSEADGGNHAGEQGTKSGELD